VIAVKVSEEDGIDGSRVDADALHVRKKRCTAVEEQAAVDDHRAVVAIGGKGCARAQEGEP
jgi:hypothetical protein